MGDEPLVFIVDDDPAARDSVAALLGSKGVAYEKYPSAEDFLKNFDESRYGCLVVDVRMEGMSGLDLQARLRAEGVDLPVIVITGYGDVPSAVTAMRTGAITFLEKPCGDHELWEAICKAVDGHRRQREGQVRLAELATRIVRLTPQERQVMDKLLAGTPNKVIAAELEIGLRTVELRRANVMKKMGARSLAELVRFSVELQDCVEEVA